MYKKELGFKNFIKYLGSVLLFSPVIAWNTVFAVRVWANVATKHKRRPFGALHTLMMRAHPVEAVDVALVFSRQAPQMK